jgi:hypothetical protein
VLPDFGYLRIILRMARKYGCLDLFESIARLLVCANGFYHFPQIARDGYLDMRHCSGRRL